MKISCNWLKDYTGLDIPPQELADILTMSGLEVEGIESYESIKGGLNGLVVGEVTHVEKHPDADKLKLTKVNVGTETPLDIVCGAPNVAAGQKVVVATVNAKLFPTTGEPFIIKKSKIRGAVSEGMICAEDEIGLGTSHAGIMVLPPDAVVGTPAEEYFKPYSDTIYEIGLTPNRMDAMSHWGVARDLRAGWIGTHLRRVEAGRVSSSHQCSVLIPASLMILPKRTMSCLTSAAVFSGPLK